MLRCNRSALTLILFASLAMALSTAPAWAVGCDFIVNSGIFSVSGQGYPDTIVWEVTSTNPSSGLKVLVSGTKNGVTDADRLEVKIVDELPVKGDTPFKATYEFVINEDVNDVGTYTRFAELEDDEGDIVCTTPILLLEVRQ